MAFTDLRATDQHYGAELTFMTAALDELVPEGLADEDDVTSIFVDAALLQVQADLYDAWGYDQGSDLGVSDFEARVALCEPNLRYALAYKQLELMYEYFDQGEDSINREKLRNYRQRYRDARGQFNSYGRADGRASIRTLSTMI